MKKTRSDSIRGYRIDFSCNTVYLNKTFAAAATRDFLSPEATRLREIREAFPTICVSIVAGRKITKTRRTKRLTYKNMEAYIGTMDNAAGLLKAFEIVKQQSKTQPSPYKHVRDWFEAQFPDYKKSKVFQEENKQEASAPNAKSENVTELHNSEKIEAPKKIA